MKKIIISLLIVASILPVVFGQNPANNTALVLIDIQEFYFDEDKLPLEGNLEAAEKSAKLLDYSRDNNYLIVHIRHQGGGAIHDLVKPFENEKVIEKQQVNAFRDTNLLEYLKENNIENLVLAGMQTHMCLEAATRAGADYGFNCTVVHDACATRDLEFEGKLVKAEDVHASTLNTLKAYAKIASLKDYLK
ncbi:MAG: cysteine hydrolase family protein [Bacteroidales bacterium]